MIDRNPTHSLLPTSPIAPSVASSTFPLLPPAPPIQSLNLSNALGSLLQNPLLQQPSFLQGLASQSSNLMNLPSTLSPSVMAPATPLHSNGPSVPLNPISYPQTMNGHLNSSNVYPTVDERGFEPCELAHYDATVPPDCIRSMSFLYFI